MTRSHTTSFLLLLAFLLPTVTVQSAVDPKYVIGIDLGTESARVGLFTLRGEMVGTVAVPYATTYPQVGWAEQNPDDWWACLGEACRRVTSAAFTEKKVNKKDIVGLCVDTTACSVVVLDSKNRPLRNCLLWCDARSASQCQQILHEAKGLTSYILFSYAKNITTIP